MDSSSLMHFIADAASAVVASPPGAEVTQSVGGHSSLSFLAIVLWAALVIFARHRLRA